MFMFSFRLKKTPLLVGGALLALALTIGALSFREAFSPQATPAEGRVATQVSVKLTGKTNDERIAFLTAHGWQVASEAIEILEVIIPAEFDEIYTMYNEMQLSQGFDLSKLAGKRCKRYAYRIENYPGAEEGVRVHVLVYKDKIIGGDVSSELSGGFMHGFAQPTKE